MVDPWRIGKGELVIDGRVRLLRQMCMMMTVWQMRQQQHDDDADGDDEELVRCAYRR